MKLLSIIVPSYNMEKYLPKCLGSLVVAPDLMDKLEVLVVNDGSKDRTSEVAHEFETKHPQTFKVIDKPNGNYGSCINAALPVAQGVWVKVLDADDWFKTENISGFIDFLSRADEAVDLILSNYTRYLPSGEVYRHSEWQFPRHETFGFDVMGKFFRDDLTMHAYTYRTNHLRGLGYKQKEGVSYSDGEWSRIPLIGVRKIAYFPHDVYQYLYGRPGQTMSAELIAANFGMEAEVALHMIGQAKNHELNEVDQSHNFVRHKIYEYLENLYRVGCFGVNGVKVNFDLAGFDRRLKVLSPEDYDAVGGTIYSPRFRYKFVEGYRRGRLVDRFLLLLCRSYPRVRRLMSSYR